MSDDPRERIIQRFVDAVSGTLTRAFTLAKGTTNDHEGNVAVGALFRGINERISEYTRLMFEELEEYDQQHPSHQFPLPPERKS